MGTALFDCLPFRGWQVIYRGESRPSYVTAWEAWDRATGEILQGDTYTEVTEKVSRVTERTGQ